MSKLASKLHNRVTIQQPNKARDEYGQLIADWQDVATVWADVKFKNGAEYQRTQVDFGDTTASVRIRLNQTTRQVDNSFRLILRDFNDQIMAIEAVLPDMATRGFMDLVCRVGRNDGE